MILRYRGKGRGLLHHLAHEPAADSRSLVILFGIAAMKCAHQGRPAQAPDETDRKVTHLELVEVDDVNPLLAANVPYASDAAG